MPLKQKLTTALLAMSISSSALAEKEVVSLTDYWQHQAKLGQTVTHMRYTPFTEQMISIPVKSSTHGNIKVQFNTHTFIPVRKPDGGISLIPTIAVIPAIHAGLGKLNNGDAGSVKAAMDLLAQSPEIPTVATIQKITGDDHLEKIHGIDLFDVVNGRIKPGAQMLTILKACKLELK